LFCLYVFRQVGPPQRVDCLVPRWEKALSVFSKDTVTRYRIRSQTKVQQPFDYWPGALYQLSHAAFIWLFITSNFFSDLLVSTNIKSILLIALIIYSLNNFSCFCENLKT